MAKTAIEIRLEELKMTQADLAARSGLSRGYINDLIRGRRGKRMGADVSRRLARALRVRPLFLLDAFAKANETEPEVRQSGQGVT